MRKIMRLSWLGWKRFVYESVNRVTFRNDTPRRVRMRLILMFAHNLS